MRPILLASLGNWGRQYQNNRHNVGHLFLSYLRAFLNPEVLVDGRAYNISRALVRKQAVDDSVPPTGADLKIFQMQNSRFRQVLSTEFSEERQVFMVQPKTFMNTSGPALKKALNDPNIPYNNPKPSLILIHDELDIPLGKFSMKLSGSANGHNGIKSCMQSLGHGDFARIRIGIGRPADWKHVESSWHRQQLVSDYVLQDFNQDEVETLNNQVFPGIKHLILKNMFQPQKDVKK